VQRQALYAATGARENDPAKFSFSIPWDSQTKSAISINLQQVPEHFYFFYSSIGPFLSRDRQGAGRQYL
jgi:hypothetical protein